MGKRLSPWAMLRDTYSLPTTFSCWDHFYDVVPVLLSLTYEISYVVVTQIHENLVGVQLEAHHQSPFSFLFLKQKN